MKTLEEIREEIIDDLNRYKKACLDGLEKYKSEGAPGAVIQTNKTLRCIENAEKNLDEYVQYEIATRSVAAAKYIAGHEYELPKHIEESGERLTALDIKPDDLIVTKITDICSNMARNNKYNTVDAEDAYAQAIYETYGFENSIASTKEIEELEKHQYDSPEDMYAYLLAVKSRGQDVYNYNIRNFNANSDLKNYATSLYNRQRRIANMSWEEYNASHHQADNKDFIDDEVMQTGKSR